MIGWRNYIHFTAPDSFKSSLFVDNLRRQQYGVKLLLALYPNPRLMYALLGTSPPPPPSKKGKAVKKSWMAKEIGFSGRSVDGRSQPTHPPGPRERGGVSEKHCNFRVHFLRAPSFRFSLSLSLSFGGGKERKRRRNKERRGRERESSEPARKTNRSNFKSFPRVECSKIPTSFVSLFQISPHFFVLLMLSLSLDLLERVLFRDWMLPALAAVNAVERSMATVERKASKVCVQKT
jgi:hypothetical protein